VIGNIKEQKKDGHAVFLTKKQQPQVICFVKYTLLEINTLTDKEDPAHPMR